MENNYVVVFNPLYRSDTDLGLRIYNIYRSPISDLEPYVIKGEFDTEEEAKAFISKEINQYYFDGYNDVSEPLFV